MQNKSIDVRKIFAFSTCFICSILVSAQSLFLNVCNLPDKNIFQEKFNIYLIGEQHFFRGNFNIRTTYHKTLISNNVYPDYILDEEGPSFSFLLNKYLETGDEKIFNIIEDNRNVKSLYEQYKAFYDSLPKDKKFRHVGIDQEKYLYMTHYAIRYIILENIQSYYASMNNYSSEDWEWVNNIIHSFEEKPYPTAWNKKNLKDDIDRVFYILNSKDSAIFKNSITIDYDIISDIRAAYNLMNKRKKFFIENESQEIQSEREIFLTNNVYKIFIHDPRAIIMAQLGFYHTILYDYLKKPKPVDKIRLANVLNNDSHYPITNKKVCSNIIYYKNTKSKQYGFLQVDFRSITPIFEEMQNCDLLIKDINNDRVNNLILYKN